MKKAFKAIFVILLGLLLVSALYYFKSASSPRLLRGSILDGAPPEYVEAIEFVSPRGTTIPQNNVVDITTVFVDFKQCTHADFQTVATCPTSDGCTWAGTCTGDLDYEDGNISGSDIVNSFIVFDETGGPTSGVRIDANQITVPNEFTDFVVDIFLSDGTDVSAGSLTVTSPACENLETIIMRGEGEGLYFGSGALPTPASSTFDFAANAYTSVNLSYLTPAAFGHQTFDLDINFVDPASTDPVNGIVNRAEILTSTGDGTYEIAVRTDATTSETASNFAYVFNDLLGINSPFFSAIQGGGSSVILTSRELGDHTNTTSVVAPDTQYECSYATSGGSSSCVFSGATVGAVDILTTPFALDSTLTQGDTALVYAAGSIGVNQWVSSHPSIIEVSLLSESDGGSSGQASVDILSEALTTAGTATLDDGTYTVSSCETVYDDQEVPQPVETTCLVDISIPVSFVAPTSSMLAVVTIDDEILEIPVSFEDDLIGSIGGSGTWSDNPATGGLSITLNGSVSGTVSGHASGNAQGLVQGTVSADVSASAQIPDDVVISNLPVDPASNLSLGALSSTSQLAEDGTPISTVHLSGDQVTDYALLYAKRPGTTILSVTDDQNCTAAIEIEVFEKRVILDMLDHDPSEMFDVGDTIQINAYLGSTDGEIDEESNVTADDSIEWISSNEDVATVDATGLITVLSPGTTNIKARYDTGEAEIGTIESDPMPVTVSKISGLTISLDETAQALLPTDVLEAAHESVLLVVHSPDAVGRTITIEGQTVDVVLASGTYDDDLAKITEIMTNNDATPTGLQTTLAVLNSDTDPVVEVIPLDGFPGIVTLRPINQDSDVDGDDVVDIDENGIIDITTTATPDEISIIPGFGRGINLPAAVTYGMMVVAEYDNGSTKRLPATDVEWINTPVNYLEQAALDTGLLKSGELRGTSTVISRFENSDGSLVTSNELAVTVESGPVIEYVRRIGSGTIVKGTQINLEVRVSDVDTIADIQDITISLVRSDYDTYNGINGDSAAVWFNATPYLDDLTVEDEGETEEETESEPVLQYKVYNLPVSIPVDQNLFDGNYKLVVSIADTVNHIIHSVYPIYIGEQASGDVNGNGTVNMIDVILAFQIAAGNNTTATQAQLEAANIDGMGGVTMVDVILLFRQLTSGS